VEKTHEDMTFMGKLIIFKDKFKDAAWFIFSILLFFGLWELGHFAGILDEYIFPAPHQFLPLLFDPSQFEAMTIRTTDTFNSKWAVFNAVGATTFRVIAGLILGFTSGSVVGYFIHYLPWFGYISKPMLKLLAGISSVAWIPLAIAILKNGEVTAVVLVAVAIFFSLALSVSEMVTNIPPTYIHAANILGASRSNIFLNVILPHTLPKLYNLMRFKFFGAWMTVLLSELFDVKIGLGLIIFLASGYLNISLAYISITLIGACGYSLDLLLRFLGKRLFWYHYATIAGEKEAF
jgi:NitT/TauT family transport system permease protein